MAHTRKWNEQLLDLEERTHPSLQFLRHIYIYIYTRLHAPSFCCSWYFPSPPTKTFNCRFQWEYSDREVMHAWHVNGKRALSAKFDRLVQHTNWYFISIKSFPTTVPYNWMFCFSVITYTLESYIAEWLDVYRYDQQALPFDWQIDFCFSKEQVWLVNFLYFFFWRN